VNAGALDGGGVAMRLVFFLCFVTIICSLLLIRNPSQSVVSRYVFHFHDMEIFR
jgi:hypothetical protein